MPRHALDVRTHFRLPAVLNMYLVRHAHKTAVAVRQVGPNDATCIVHKDGTYTWVERPPIPAKQYLNTVIVRDENAFLGIVDAIRERVLP